MRRHINQTRMTIVKAGDFGPKRCGEMQNGRRYSPAVRAVRSDEHPSYFTISLAVASRVTPPNVPLKVIV